MERDYYILSDILSERIQAWLSGLTDIHEALIESSDTEPNSFIYRLASEIHDLYGEP